MPSSSRITAKNRLLAAVRQEDFEPERSAMAGWYVAYRGEGSTVWSMARSRAEAISMVCGMLGRGIDAEEIGPLREMPDGEIIDSGEIRKVHTMQDQRHG